MVLNQKVSSTFLSMLAVLEQEHESELDAALGLIENQWPPMRQNGATNSCCHMRDRTGRIYKELCSFFTTKGAFSSE